ncbi:ABC transporter [Actinomadura madurae]|uniref:ABC transporter n=1 Tax=Actinomadura madurae TaxID=1993 RepID=A0A1I5YGI3_9ACTN|nr:ABC transporter [Actinomadura madurae]
MSPSPTPPAGAAGTLLSLRGVSKSFGAVAALTGVDLDVAAGEVVALVGDNGAGKSTLVKVLSGVHAPDAGTITFESREVTIPTPAAAQQLGIATVFQDLALCENLNVIENLFLGRELRALRLDDVAMEVRSRELLTQLSAKIPSVGVPVAALSGGQRQTVAIARSLLGDPKVIILDEPTAALGVAQTAEVLNLIERLRERGHGVIMISHNMADVTAVADTVAVLRLGRNNGVFDARTTSAEELVAAITGATDNVVSRRAGKATTATESTAADDNATPQEAATPGGDPTPEGGAAPGGGMPLGDDVASRGDAAPEGGAEPGQDVTPEGDAAPEEGAASRGGAVARGGAQARGGTKPGGGAGGQEAAGESAGIGDVGVGERAVRGRVRKGAGDE